MNAKTSDSLRLFYALWPDDATGSSLLQLQASMRGRLVPYSNLHMTLVFLGQQPAALLSDLKDVLLHLPAEEVSLTLDRVGYFTRNRIAWAGSLKAPDSLFNLQRNLVSALTERKIVFNSEHNYKPHVTLARDAELPADLAFDPIVWKATEVALVQSTTRPEGPEYRVLATRSIDKPVWIPDQSGQGSAEAHQ